MSPSVPCWSRSPSPSLVDRCPARPRDGVLPLRRRRPRRNRPTRPLISSQTCQPLRPRSSSASPSVSARTRAGPSSRRHRAPGGHRVRRSPRDSHHAARPSPTGVALEQKTEKLALRAVLHRLPPPRRRHRHAPPTAPRHEGPPPHPPRPSPRRPSCARASPWEAAHVLRSRFARIPEKHLPTSPPLRPIPTPRDQGTSSLLAWNAHYTSLCFLFALTPSSTGSRRPGPTPAPWALPSSRHLPSAAPPTSSAPSSSS